MNKKVMLSFLKDHFFISLAIYGSSFLVILFYWLQVGNQVEVVYPFILVTFVYLLFMTVRAHRYIKFNRFLETFNGRMDDQVLKAARISGEQKKVIETIKVLESESITKLNQFELQNENKYKVISQIIHNLKTPTAVIDLIVQNSKEDGKLADDVLDKINKENRLINENLDQVLNYLRLDYFQNDFSIEETDLILQLRELINQKKDHFIYNEVFPQLLVKEEKVLVLTDKKWNKQMLDQLISNAIKYSAMKKGNNRVFFRIRREDKRVYLTIEDTGIGISNYDLKRVFEPFFTGENGRKTRSATGIGLSICKSISERLNHSIDISSNEGVGTKVVITYLTKV